MFEDHVTKIADCGPLKLDGAVGVGFVTGTDDA